MWNAEERLEQCVDKLYGALTAPETLLDAVRAIRLTFDASGATHLHFDAKGKLAGIIDDGHDPSAQREYVEHFAGIDPTRTLLTLKAGEWLWDDTLLDPRHTSEPEFVNDFAPRIGMRYFMGCKLFEGERGIASFSLQRGSDARPFDQDTFALMQVLQPHLKRVFRMLLDVAPVPPALSSAGIALDVLQIPICVVDDACRVVYANPAAEQMLAESKSVKVSHGRLRCIRPEAHELLERAVGLASRPPRTASAFSPTPNTSTVGRLQVRAIPIGEHLSVMRWGRGDLVLLFLASGSAPPRVEELQQLFGLTRAEAELASLLAEGASTDECAIRRGVSLSTVRTQLQAVFGKTGAGSQGQLISMVLALPRVR